jgi:hypothetical protein
MQIQTEELLKPIEHRSVMRLQRRVVGRRLRMVTTESPIPRAEVDADEIAPVVQQGLLR